MIFQNFFHGKLKFFPTILGENFPGKMVYEKSAPGANPTTSEFSATTPAL
jgi:hypothetical protein